MRGEDYLICFYCKSIVHYNYCGEFEIKHISESLQICNDCYEEKGFEYEEINCIIDEDDEKIYKILYYVHINNELNEIRQFNSYDDTLKFIKSNPSENFKYSYRLGKPILNDDDNNKGEKEYYIFYDNLNDLRISLRDKIYNYFNDGTNFIMSKKFMLEIIVSDYKKQMEDLQNKINNINNIYN